MVKWVYTYQDNSNSNYILVAELKNKIAVLIMPVFFWCHCLINLYQLYACFTVTHNHWKRICQNSQWKYHNCSLCLIPLFWLHTQHLSDDLYLQIKNFQNKVLQYPKTSLLICFSLPIKLPLQHLSRSGVVYCQAESISFSCSQFQIKLGIVPSKCCLFSMKIFYLICAPHCTNKTIASAFWNWI